jgi:hypothetical protein
VDLSTELSQKHPDGWTNLHFYEAWRDSMRAIEPGRYDVIGVDTIEPIESGITDWVAQNPSYFGRTPRQYDESRDRFWSDVDTLLAVNILELRVKAKMVILTANMTHAYQEGRRVRGKRQRKGRHILSKLATLEIELAYNIGDTAPSAKVLKSPQIPGGSSKTRPMFDQWISPFTWSRVVEYMQTGTDTDDPILPPDDA